MSQQHQPSQQSQSNQQGSQFGQPRQPRSQRGLGQQSGQYGGHQPQSSQGFQGGGQYRGGTHGQLRQQGSSLQSVMTPQHRAALDGIAQAMAVTGYCAKECVEMADQRMVECIQSCTNVMELGETSLTLVGTFSRYAPQVLRAFKEALDECAQICSQHQHASCQECATVLPQTSQQVTQLLELFGQQGHQRQQGATEQRI